MDACGEDGACSVSQLGGCWPPGHWDQAYIGTVTLFSEDPPMWCTTPLALVVDHTAAISIQGGATCDIWHEGGPTTVPLTLSGFVEGAEAWGTSALAGVEGFGWSGEFFETEPATLVGTIAGTVPAAALPAQWASTGDWMLDMTFTVARIDCASDPFPCDDYLDCTADTCDDQTGCGHEPEDAPCDDDDACTVDTCDLLTGCLHESLGCDDDDACTVDTCDPDAGCVHETDDALCNDGDACTEDECDPTDGCQHAAMAPEACDDGDLCTLDTCLPATGCSHIPVTCAQPEDACLAAECDPTTGCVVIDVSATCDDGDACTEDACSPIIGCWSVPSVLESCDDGDPCTLDGCHPFVGCTWEPIGCEDSDLCTLDWCDAGKCLHADSSADCDDGDACTLDGCDPETGCYSSPVECPDDGDPCTTEYCDPTMGCSATPTLCDDGDACTVDGCDPETGCAHGGLLCGDGDPCTVDACDSATGCTHASIPGCAGCAEDAACADDDPCSSDLCMADGGCVSIPVEIACDDEIPCTADDCDPEFGCTHQLIHSDCDDEDACTADYCDPLQGCVHADIEPQCDDGDPCTADACDPQSGCVHTPGAATTCDDGLPCTLLDLCQSDGCASLTLPDGFSCPVSTTATCSSGRCCPGITVWQGTGCGFVDAGVVFVTSEAWDGALGGPATADALCDGLAGSAGLVGSYRAWLSTSVEGAPQRVDDQPYRRPDGVLVADGLGSLATTGPAAPIGQSESGVELDTTVWTGTGAGGVPGPTCSDWLAVEAEGMVGVSAALSEPWTASGAVPCDTVHHLYCFQRACSQQGYDLASDPSHCGSCDSQCGPDQVCLGGTCTDVAPCGEAGVTCPGATECLDGACGFPGGALAFVTSTTHDGDLGGLAGADAICQTTAEEANLGGSWVAWLSDTGADAIDRAADHPYHRVDGALLAESVLDLAWSLPDLHGLHASLSLDEQGAPVGEGELAWTGTRAWMGLGPLDPGGRAAEAHCSDWHSATKTGLAGAPDAEGAAWTQAGDQDCGTALRLYCLQQ